MSEPKPFWRLPRRLARRCGGSTNVHRPSRSDRGEACAGSCGPLPMVWTGGLVSAHGASAVRPEPRLIRPESGAVIMRTAIRSACHWFSLRADLPKRRSCVCVSKEVFCRVAREDRTDCSPPTSGSARRTRH